MFYITLQACVLGASSNVIAQLITAYKSNAPYTIDWTSATHFIIFSAISCPPNFLWQSYLEDTFPSTTLVPSPSAIAAASKSNDAELDREEKTHEILEPKLSKRHTLIKFLLDQTVGAAINTLLFSVIFALFKGADVQQAVQISLQDFWALMIAGWKLWPMVSFVNFTLVESVETRNLVGSLAGMGWNIYLSLIAGES